MSHIRTAILEAGLQQPIPPPPRRMAQETGQLPWHAALATWLGRLRARDELRALTERERRDAGLTAYDVAIESRKLPWRD